MCLLQLCHSKSSKVSLSSGYFEDGTVSQSAPASLTVRDSGLFIPSTAMFMHPFPESQHIRASYFRVSGQRSSAE